MQSVGDELTLHRVCADDFDDRLATWLPLYRSCFSLPPWNETVTTVADYLSRVESHRRHENLVGFEVRAGADVVAACYGWQAETVLPDGAIYRMLAEAIGAGPLDDLWRMRPFEFVELMVLPTHRGKGLARRLIAELCPSGPAWLATAPDSSAARLYDQLGWRLVGTARGSGELELAFYVLD